jgi:hypothetical protein
VVQRAGEHGLPGESVVAEEEAVTEAIHAAAHPGRTRAAEGDTPEASEPRAADDAAVATAGTETAPDADSEPEAEGEAPEAVS